MLMDSAVIRTHAQRVEYWRCLMHTLPDEVGQGDILPFCFRSPTVNTDPFRGLFNAVFPPFLCFLLAILLFTMVPKGSTERLPRVPKCKEAVMCLPEKMRV